jgi:hypothetical protein
VRLCVDFIVKLGVRALSVNVPVLLVLFIHFISAFFAIRPVGMALGLLDCISIDCIIRDD